MGSISSLAGNSNAGSGLDRGVKMGPVNSPASKNRIEGLIGKAIQHGVKALLDGNNAVVDGGKDGCFAEPTIPAGLDPGAVSILTASGNAARKFRYAAPSGNIGVNIGVAAPTAYFPFSGWKDGLLGVLYGQGRDGVASYIDKKIAIELWPKEWFAHIPMRVRRSESI
jgi:malonate-semialdehyde dehydrogenase (acetylating) / methylmalonate-semialdehyde dehydrogenase